MLLLVFENQWSQIQASIINKPAIYVLSTYSSRGNSMELNLRTYFDFKFLKWMAPFSFHALHLFCWLSQEAGLLKLNFLIVRKTWLYYSCFPGILLLNIRILSTNMVFLQIQKYQTILVVTFCSILGFFDWLNVFLWLPPKLFTMLLNFMRILAAKHFGCLNIQIQRVFLSRFTFKLNIECISKSGLTWIISSDVYDYPIFHEYWSYQGILSGIHGPYVKDPTHSVSNSAKMNLSCN